MSYEANTLERWSDARQTCRDEELDALDARFAEEMGYKGLAAIHAVLDSVSKAERSGRRPTASEIMAQLRSVAAIVNGEADVDLRERTGGQLTMPGVKLAGITPRNLAAHVDRSQAA